MSKKVNYKLIFSDLDQTLIVKNHIPTFNLESIKKAKEKGVKFIISTGRNYDYMCHLLKELETENLENEYTICNSGSTIYENKNKNLIYFKGIDNETLNLVFEYGKKINEIFIMFDTFNGTFLYNEDKLDKENMKYFKYKVIKNIDDIKNTEIIRIVFSKNDLKFLKNIEKEIKKDNNFVNKVSYYISANRFLEFNAFGVSKGEALKWLSNYLKVDIKETIAIGDNYNDESMIKVAGLGCCVKSANDDIKKISKYICEKDYFEGSVKEIIDKFILN